MIKNQGLDLHIDTVGNTSRKKRKTIDGKEPRKVRDSEASKPVGKYRPYIQ